MTQQYQGLRQFWARHKFKLNGLVLLLPFWFLYQSLNLQFPPALPKAQLGPYAVTAMPLSEDGPYAHHGEWVKDYYLQWCAGCVEKIRQGFLLVSDNEPDLASLSRDTAACCTAINMACTCTRAHRSNSKPATNSG